MKTLLRRQQADLSLAETFLRLAAITTPHGHEAYCWALLPFHDSDLLFDIDRDNNVHFWVSRPDGTDPQTMWCSHLDSACMRAEPVVFARDKNTGEISTNGDTILSADDKIGAAIMIKMLQARVPGWYVFHAGEECGLVGARALAHRLKAWPIVPNLCISLDRKGKGSIITKQRGRTCCSSQFVKQMRKALAAKGMQWRADPGGSFTDSAAYMDIVPECTNLSVGYYDQHTTRERLDIRYAEQVMNALIKAGKAGLFEAIVSHRDPEEAAREAAKAEKERKKLAERWKKESAKRRQAAQSKTADVVIDQPKQMAARMLAPIKMSDAERWKDAITYTAGGKTIAVPLWQKRWLQRRGDPKWYMRFVWENGMVKFTHGNKVTSTLPVGTYTGVPNNEKLGETEVAFSPSLPYSKGESDVVIEGDDRSATAEVPLASGD